MTFLYLNDSLVNESPAEDVFQPVMYLARLLCLCSARSIMSSGLILPLLSFFVVPLPENKHFGILSVGRPLSGCQLSLAGAR